MRSRSIIIVVAVVLGVEHQRHPLDDDRGALERRAAAGIAHQAGEHARARPRGVNAAAQRAHHDARRYAEVGPHQRVSP